MKNSEKTIIAMGSGGFTHEPENSLLDLYILKQSSSKKPKISFLPTAHSDPANYIANFHKSFSQHSCSPSHLDLFNLHTSDLEDYLLSQDIIYVGGGNTKSMLAVWREWEIDTILKEAWSQGIILAGVSAGAMCWFDEGVTASIPERMTSIKCLGILSGSCCPHYDASIERQKLIHDRVESGAVKKGYLIDDNTALHFLDNSVKCAISSVPNKKASVIEKQEIIPFTVYCLADHQISDLKSSSRKQSYKPSF